MTALAAAAGDEMGDAAADPVLINLAATVMSIFTVVYVVIFVLMFKRIMIAVKVVKEACKALAAMPLLVFQPVCTMVSLLLLYAWTAIITMYFMSAGEFDMTTGTFVYSGGTCGADLQKAGLNYTARTALLTMVLTTDVVVKRGQLSRDKGATWGALLSQDEMAAGSADFELNHTELKGSECKWSSLTQTDRCAKNVNVSSSKSLGLGSCLGAVREVPPQGYGPACEAAKALAQSFANALGDTGVLHWNATLGSLKLWVAPSYKEYTVKEPTGMNVEPSVTGTVELAVPLGRCDDGGACASWQISGQSIMRKGEVIGTWSLETKEVYSEYNVSFPEASRACNQVAGNTERATKKLRLSKYAAAAKQGKADLNEVVVSYEIKNVTVDNWKSFIPVTLDGSTYNYFAAYHLFMFLW